MENMELIKGALKETFDEIKQLVDKQEAEIKQNGETAAKTAKALEEANTRMNQLQEDMKGMGIQYDEIMKAQQRLHGGGEKAESLGEMFTKSDVYKQYTQSPGGKSLPFELKTLTGAALDNTPAYLYPTQRIPGYFANPDRVDRVRDLIPTMSTSVGSLEFIQQTGFVNNAATVPEFEAQYEGGHVGPEEKPKSSLNFGVVTVPVRTIAHWLPVTRQIIEDASMLRSHIDQRLIYGLKLEEDNQLLYGTGIGNDLQGILTHGGIQGYQWSTGVVGDLKIDAIRRAITLAMIAEYPVSGIVVNPADWEDIELAKGSDGHYIWVTIPNGGQQQLWRAPVVVTNSIVPGEALIGAFSLGTALWDRMQAAIRVSDSHDTFFTKNMWAILAEERLAQTIYRPEAFVKVEFDAAPVAP